MIGVRTDDEAFRAAAAELPARMRLVPEGAGDAGAVIAVVGAGEVPGLAPAPAAVVLADPPLPAGALPPGIPVVVDRAWLRQDVAADAGAPRGATLLTAECAAPACAADLCVRDAVGWLRSLAGEDLDVDAVHATGAGVIALLRAGTRAATLALTILADPSAPARLRVLAVGPERVEVTVDGTDSASVVVSTEKGSLTLPARHESRRRLSLRRAADAAVDGAAADLDELRHDERVADVILQRYKQKLFSA